MPIPKTHQYCIYRIERDGSSRGIAHVDAPTAYDAMLCARAKYPEYIRVDATFFAARTTNPNGERGLFRVERDTPTPPPVRIVPTHL